MTTTKTTTNTKMAIATLAMLGAGAMALAATPPLKGTPQTPRSLCSVSSFNVSKACQPGQPVDKASCPETKDAIGVADINKKSCRVFSHAEWTCSDGSKQTRDTLTCKSEQAFRSDAERFCGSLSCVPTQEICVDRDGGADIFTASQTVIMINGQEAGGDNVIDACDTASNSTVLEGICSGNQGVSGNPIPTVVSLPCGAGFMCSNGACVAQSPRTQVHISWASDTPSGASSPSTWQTVGKFIISNIATPNQYVATIKTINLDFTTTMSADNLRIIRIFKDNPWGAALLYKTFATGTPFSDTSFTDADFQNVDIASGSSKTFYVVLDTSASRPNNSLSIRVGANDVEWSDGALSSITGDLGGDLPLPYKTLAY